jgi:alanyl-tRNA synthetase|uniref:Alanine--tRNA ligase n=1 Tax=Desulfobacca acetoxidans TaxID=60893 RepID=A0A7V6A3E4_9BACT
MNSRDVRNTFLSYFNSQGHTVVPSSSLVPHGDPTLLFTNAGMVQFKRTFLGEEQRPYVRAASSQKCVRAGGKHNDLENVGYTARHHTFFEMLGNFSFGDYFKEGAIQMAWELLTKKYGLPKDRLWATVYHEDDEARELWQKIAGLPPERIIGLGEKDNFWAMGDTGPCGPCSEIIFDQGEAVACGPDCGIGVCECDRYLEIWNLVFMQFNRTADGVMTPLPRPSIDTGMGLERLSAVLQGVHSNFDTDLLRPIIGRVEDLAGLAYGADDSKKSVAFRVIADHARATAFLMADGVLPSNEGRGYVLRRIMRRALRYGRLLDLKTPFLPAVTRKVVELMGDIYPELVEAQTLINQVVTNEEERFAETLDHGLKLLAEEVAAIRGQGGQVLPGAVAFRLYDTYGFPLDLVQDALREEGLDLDIPGYEKHMQVQREASRASWQGGAAGEIPAVYQELAEESPTEFLGYQTLRADSPIQVLIKGEVRVDRARAGDQVEIITAATPFYGESGGQVGDTGVISGEGFTVEVTNTTRLPNDIFVHQGVVKTGEIGVGTTAHLEVDASRRRAIARHHTATHILQAVLQRELGGHVKQSGSLVAPERFRFDFTHFAAITPDELAKIELELNAAVLENLPVETSIMSMAEALKSGAMALFEEKYGDRVRLVAIPGISKELCGGTHVSRTGDIGLVKIITEAGIAAGIRRIEAVCGLEALKLVREEEEELSQAAGLLKAGRGELLDRLAKVLKRTRELEKEVTALKGRLTAVQAGDLLEQVRQVDGVPVLALEVEAGDPKGLREFAAKLSNRLKSGIVVLGSRGDDKAMLIALVSKDLTSRFNAGEIIRELAPLVGGSGGGRADMAQAGGPDKEKVAEAIKLAYELVARKVKQ